MPGQGVSAWPADCMSNGNRFTTDCRIRPAPHDGETDIPGTRCAPGSNTFSP